MTARGAEPCDGLALIHFSLETSKKGFADRPEGGKVRLRLIAFAAALLVAGRRGMIKPS